MADEVAARVAQLPDVPLTVGDICAVTKAGAWRLDGRITRVRDDGTYDVALRGESITLTEKPRSEVRKHDFGPDAQREMQASAVQRRVDTELRTATIVRRNQTRVCCCCCHLLSSLLTAAAVLLFVHAFSLKSAIDAGGCTIHGRYGSNDFEAGSAQCNELFQPLVWVASIICVFALMSLMMQAIGREQCWSAWTRGGSLSPGYTRTWSLCAVVGFTHTCWCVGEFASSDELGQLDSIRESAATDRMLALFRGMSGRLSRLATRQRPARPTPPAVATTV